MSQIFSCDLCDIEGVISDFKTYVELLEHSRICHDYIPKKES